MVQATDYFDSAENSSPIFRHTYRGFYKTRPHRRIQLSQKLLIGLTVLAIGAPLFAGTINFDDQNTIGGAVALSNQYASSGVLFSDIYAAQNFKFNIIPPSGLNYASPFWADLNPGFITFVDPANALQAAVVDTVSFTLVGLTASDAHPGNFIGATIDALDADGNVIAGQTVVVPATSVNTANQVLTFTGGVHELRFTMTSGTGAFPIDDLVIGNLSDVPEPSTFALLTAGGIFAAALRRRRK
jgi:hypothetical protein